MMFSVVKAVHIIFVVTWFSGLFYVVRLFIYNTEASEEPVLRRQYGLMIRRLWLGITWPSAVLTAIFGPWTAVLYGAFPSWLVVKLALVAGLYGYHFSLHRLYVEQQRGIFRFASFQLRLWNEVATVFLVCIVLEVVLKSVLGWLWGLILLPLFLGGAVVYRRRRKRVSKPPSVNP